MLISIAKHLKYGILIWPGEKHAFKTELYAFNKLLALKKRT